MERSFGRPDLSDIRRNMADKLTDRVPVAFKTIEYVAGIIECRNPYVNGIVDPQRARELLMNRGVSAVGIYVAGTMLSHKVREIFSSRKIHTASSRSSE